MSIIPRPLRNTQRSMYNYTLERERARAEHDGRPGHTGRNIGIAAVLLAGVLIAPSTVGDQDSRVNDTVSYEAAVED